MFSVVPHAHPAKRNEIHVTIAVVMEDDWEWQFGPATIIIVASTHNQDVLGFLVEDPK